MPEMKPMLASSWAKAELRFPVMASPKLDGIRAIVVNGVVMSRTMKPIPNRNIQALFGHERYNGLDGELIVGRETDKPADLIVSSSRFAEISIPGNVMQRTTSVVMSHDKHAHDVTYRVFDHYLTPGTFFNRLRYAGIVIEGHRQMKLVEHTSFEDDDALMAYEAEMVEAGYEGIMLRDPAGPYKQGRATAAQGWLLKVKRFEDAEAIVFGSIEEMHNTNEAVVNELGRTSRSTAKAGKVGKDRLGALQVRLMLDPAISFEIGSGFTAEDRAALWAVRDNLIGKIVNFRHQPSGAKDKPRFPIFHGFRNAIDVGEAA